MAPCPQCNDDQKENCQFCSKEDISLSQVGGGEVCVCGLGTKPKTLMKCSECEQWWHSGCVGLGPLTQSITSKIESWKCPLCFKFASGIREKLGKAGEREMKVDESEIVDLSGITDTMCKDIKEIKDILISKVVPNVANTSTKVSETLDANWRRQTQSWADIVANQKAIEQKISTKQKEEAVLVTNVINSSQQKIERDNIEREKRKRNVVIRELEEPDEGSSEERKYSDKMAVTEILSLDSSDVIQVWRAGPPKRNYNRPVVVTVSTPEIAQNLHNYGRGKRIENLNDEREYYWCNPDLIETDRKANFKAREEARRRRTSRGENRREQHHRRDEQPREGHHDHGVGHTSPVSSEASSRRSRSASPQHITGNGRQGFS